MLNQIQGKNNKNNPHKKHKQRENIKIFDEKKRDCTNTREIGLRLNNSYGMSLVRLCGRCS